MSTWIRNAWMEAVKLKRLSDIRRKELRQAAFAVLEREGIAGATLEKVAAHAGASKGIVLHYFRNKQELFEHAMREANAVLRDAVVARLRQARTPMERLDAVIDGNCEELRALVGDAFSRARRPVDDDQRPCFFGDEQPAVGRERTIGRIDNAVRDQREVPLRLALG